MKKALAVVGLLMIPALFLSKEARADGNYGAALVVSTVTNQGYLYPSYPQGTANPIPGGFLVGNGTLFDFSNIANTSTTSATTQHFPALPLVTAAQVFALQAGTTGQIALCTNCTSGNTGLGLICFSTGSTTTGQFVGVSSAAAVTSCK